RRFERDLHPIARKLGPKAVRRRSLLARRRPPRWIRLAGSKPHLGSDRACALQRSEEEHNPPWSHDPQARRDHRPPPEISTAPARIVEARTAAVEPMTTPVPSMIMLVSRSAWLGALWLLATSFWVRKMSLTSGTALPERSTTPAPPIAMSAR